MSSQQWRHLPTGTLASYVGEDRDLSGTLYAVMETTEGVRARIDPLDLVRVPPVWEKVDANASTGEQR